MVSAGEALQQEPGADVTVANPPVHGGANVLHDVGHLDDLTGLLAETESLHGVPPFLEARVYYAFGLPSSQRPALLEQMPSPTADTLVQSIGSAASAVMGVQ